MASGDRSKKGNRTDYARHYSEEGDGGAAFCGNKRAGFTTHDKNEVDCLKCRKALRLGPMDEVVVIGNRLTGVL